MNLFPNLGIDALARTRKAYEPSGKPGLQEARRAAGQFESLFLNLLLERMEKAETGEGFFGEEAGSQIQDSLFVTMLSRSLAEKGPGLGLADKLVEDWVRRGWVAGDHGKDAKDAGRKMEVRHA